MFARLAAALAVFAALSLAPSRADAAGLTLGLGANYWLRSSGVFNFDLTIDERVARSFSIGGRFGVSLLTGPARVGIPLDLTLRFDVLRQLYVELTGGPWIYFDDAAVVRAHIAFGFGMKTGNIMFGPEVGYLEPNGILGVRLAFRL